MIHLNTFLSDADAKRQEEFFAPPMRLGRFQRIDYYTGESTTEIIHRIQHLPAPASPRGDTAIATTSSPDTHSQPLPGGKSFSAPGCRASKPQWFGAAVANATNYAAMIATSPFSAQLRGVIEPHVRKAAVRRDSAIAAIREATGVVVVVAGCVSEGRLGSCACVYMHVCMCVKRRMEV